MTATDGSVCPAGLEGMAVGGLYRYRARLELKIELEPRAQTSVDHGENRPV